MKLDPQLVAAIVGGVIGIAGSIIALIVEHYLRQSGKITAITEDVTIKKVVGDEESDQVILIVAIYNSSDVPRNLRNVRIEIKEREKFPRIILNLGRNYYYQIIRPFIFRVGSRGEKLDFLHLPPKVISQFDFSFYARKMDFKNKYAIFYLVANYPNGGTHRQRILYMEGGE